MARIYNYSIDSSERSLQLVARQQKSVKPRYILPDEGRRIVIMRGNGYSIRQIWVALRASGRYTEEDIIDHIEAWRREEGFIAGLKLSGGKPTPPSPGMIQRLAA